MAVRIQVIMHRKNIRIVLGCLGIVAFVMIEVLPILNGVRVLVGLAFILFVPGFTLTTALFPRRTDLDTTERLALSFGLSLAVIPLLALVLDRLPWGIRFWPILVSEGSFILIFTLAALFRRRRLPEDELLQIGRIPNFRLWWALLGREERWLYRILAGTLTTALLSAAIILFWPSPAKFFTEFYLLGPNRLAEYFPREARLNEELSVIVGITSHERTAKTYQVEVQVENPQDPGDPLWVGGAGPVTLQPGAAHENSIQWKMPSVGQDQVIEFLLLDEEGTSIYRRLRLIVNIEP